MLHSLVTRGGGSAIHVHYLHGLAFPARSARRIAGMAERLGAAITLHRIEPGRVAGLSVLDEFTPAMWYRVLLPELLPDVERALYLDVDTLVLDAIAPLWDIPLGGASVAAVTNVLLDKHRHRPGSLGLPPEQPYFNSGVLLMDLERMRRGHAAEAIRSAARAGGSAFEWPDQDALNVVLGAGHVVLPPRWNAMNSLWLREAADVFGSAELHDARERPAIRHFEGPGDNKPWHAACARPHAGRWVAHRRRTPWPWIGRTGTAAERAELLARRARRLARRICA